MDMKEMQHKVSTHVGVQRELQAVANTELAKEEEQKAAEQAKEAEKAAEELENEQEKAAEELDKSAEELENEEEKAAEELENEEEKAAEELDKSAEELENEQEKAAEELENEEEKAAVVDLPSVTIATNSSNYDPAVLLPIYEAKMTAELNAANVSFDGLELTITKLGEGRVRKLASLDNSTAQVVVINARIRLQNAMVAASPGSIREIEEIYEKTAASKTFNEGVFAQLNEATGGDTVLVGLEINDPVVTAGRISSGQYQVRFVLWLTCTLFSIAFI